MKLHKKIRAADKAVFSSWLPEELIEDILLSLPVKSLVRFRTVCKSWNSLIQTSTFIQAHLSGSRSRSLLLMVDGEVEKRPEGVIAVHELFSLHWDNPPFHVYNNHKLIDHPFADYKRVHVVGTCKGLVCLASPDPTFNSVLIWNPCVRKHVILPQLIPDRELNYEVDDCIYGFGYDSQTNDYKVVRVVSYYDVLTCAVWSLKKPSWNSISADRIPPVAIPVFYTKNVLINGVVHWVVEDANYHDNSFCIVAFDISNEQFGKIEFPKEILGDEIQDVCLSRYRNSLALFFSESEGHDYKDEVLDMWIMKEYGVVESWSKLFSVQIPDVDLIGLHGFRNNGEAMISLINRSKYNDKKKWVNPRSPNIIKEFQVDGFEYKDCEFVEPFVESLVLLDQLSAMSDHPIQSP